LQNDVLVQFLPLILIFVVFYFLLIRPQQKKMRDHRDMLASVRRGDRIVTGGGIIGQVVKVGGGDELTVEIAEGVRVKALRSTVSAVLARPEPAKASRAARAEADEEEEEEEPVAETPPQPAEDRWGGIARFIGRK
jgi:preprotein translocase subunit YajC